MNKSQQRICLCTIFAVFIAAFADLIRAVESHSSFDADSFVLEAVVILIIGGICYVAKSS